MTQDKLAEPPSSGGARSRHFGAQLAGGATLGFAASCFFGPGFLGWWYEPPIKDAFSCASSVRAALSQFVKMQLISAAVGGVLAMVVVFFVRRALQRPEPPVQPATGS
jgi:hypothetical protein